MIQSVELLCAFNGNYITNVFNHTYNLFFTGDVAADITYFGIGNIAAFVTEQTAGGQLCKYEINTKHFSATPFVLPFTYRFKHRFSSFSVFLQLKNSASFYLEPE